MILGMTALHISIRPDSVASRPTNPKISVGSLKSIAAEIIPVAANIATAKTCKADLLRERANSQIKARARGTAMRDVAEREPKIMKTHMSKARLYARRWVLL